MGPTVPSGAGSGAGAVVGSAVGSTDGSGTGSGVGSGVGGLMTSGSCLTKENRPVVALTVPLVYVRLKTFVPTSQPLSPVA